MTRTFAWLLSLLWLLPLAAPQWCLAVPVQGFFPAPAQPLCPAWQPDALRPGPEPGGVPSAQDSARYPVPQSHAATGESTSVAMSANGFRYTGEQWDPNAALYYNRARWMDPQRGRFVSVDGDRGLARAPLSQHAYIYGKVSPLRYSDPSGRNYISIAQFGALFGTMAALSGVAVATPAEGIAPPAYAILHNQVYKGRTEGLYKIFRLALLGGGSFSTYFTVQWVQGVAKRDGKVPNDDICNRPMKYDEWELDACPPEVVYKGYEDLGGLAALHFDTPGMQRKPDAGPMPIGMTLEVELHFVTNVYARSRYPNPTRDEFKSTSTPTPLLSITWEIVDEYEATE